MEIKRTLILSALLHVILFSAALLLFRGSRNIQADDIFFVRLAEDIKRSNVEEIAAKIERPAPSLPVKEEKTLHHDKTYHKPVLPKTFDAIVRNDPGTEPETVKNVSADIPHDVTDAGGKEAVSATATLVINDDKKYHQDVDTNLSGGTGGVNNEGTRLDEIIAFIANAIERTKAYPLWARKKGIEGTVFVSFRIGRDGKPEELVIQKSSGFKLLDTATLDVINAAAPFPYIEDRIEIPVTYRLKD